MSETIALHGRHRAYLRAVRDGRAEMTCSCEPDLYVDGLGCCDQMTAHQLAEAHLIAPAQPGTPGQRVPAELTTHGKSALLAGAPAAGAAAVGSPAGGSPGIASISRQRPLARTRVLTGMVHSGQGVTVHADGSVDREPGHQAA